MIIRDFQPSDEMSLRRMHAAQGYGYELPDLLDPRLWIVQKVLEDKEGKPVKAILGRLTSEAMFLDYPGTENDFTRMRRFMVLQDVACEEGRRMGMDSVHVWLPPELKAQFGERLERMGWIQFTWPSFMRRLYGSRGH